MNWQRILRISNCYLLISGFQLHRFEPKTQRFHLSIWGIANFILLTLFYTICVNQHFINSPLLRIFHDVSPFFWLLIRIQLMLGLKVYIFRLFTMAEVGRACDKIASLSPRAFAHKFNMEEAIAYFLIFSTFLISFCFALYISYEMEFKLPSWDNIFISFGLFIPHFVVAGALKLYTLNCWLLYENLRHLEMEFEDIFGREQFVNGENSACDMSEMEVNVSAANTYVKMPTSDVIKQLEEHQKRFQQLAGELKLVSVALEKELLLLLLMNSSCLLAGVYSLVYFKTSWHLFFSPSWKRIFYAANTAIYVLIFWDYLCLCTSVIIYNKAKLKVIKRVQVAFKSANILEKRARAILKAIRNVLTLELELRLFSDVNVSVKNLLKVHILLGLIISLVVMYQYINDQIVSITTRLDSADNDDY